MVFFGPRAGVERATPDPLLEMDVGMLADLVRDALVVPENRLADDVLEDFQEQEILMAIVVDEWGSFEGLITAEDIFEEIVG